MVGIVVLGGVAVCGGAGVVAGGTAAAAIHFITKGKSPDEDNPDVKIARRNEPTKEKQARMLGLLSRTTGFALSTIGGAMTGGACAISFFEKSWVHGSFRDSSASEVFLDSKVIGSLTLGILGLGLIKLGNKLTNYGNTTVCQFLNTPEVQLAADQRAQAAMAERARQEEADNARFAAAMHPHVN